MHDPVPVNTLVTLESYDVVVAFKQNGEDVTLILCYNNTGDDITFNIPREYYGFLFKANTMLPYAPGIMVQNASNNKVMFVDMMQDNGQQVNSKLVNAVLDIDAIKRMYQ